MLPLLRQHAFRELRTIPSPHLSPRLLSSSTRPLSSHVVQASLPPRRQLHSPPASAPSVEVLNWMERIKLIDILETDTLDRSKALQLLYTLPNRAPPDDQASRPQSNDPLPNGHHLIYFSPLISESELNTDGTDPTYNSPPPFTRRMWAGGSFEFHPRHKLRIGEDVSCRTTVASVDYKITGSEPMIFVNQLRDFKNPRGESAVTERRTHVFLKPPTTGKHSTKASPVLRDGTEPVDYTFSCTPSPATLFRFSALTFNSHYIHLDPEFSRNVDGHPERLVHGPLVALMLLDIASANLPASKTVATFRYRARYPVIVNRRLTFTGKWRDQGGKNINGEAWATDEDGRVCMSAEITLQ